MEIKVANQSTNAVILADSNISGPREVYTTTDKLYGLFIAFILVCAIYHIGRNLAGKDSEDD